MRFLVTGATGFVGRLVCSELLGREHEVVSLVRRPGSEPEGTEAVRGDLADAERLAAAVQEAAAECVVHLAAEIGTQKDAARIHEVNVVGMRRLLDACAAAGTRRFLFVSTVVTGDAHGAILDEGSQLPVETAYGASKQEGERLLRDSGLEWVIVRPSHVYGPGGWFATDIVERLRQPGRFVQVGRGENLWDVVHVDDLARAIADAAERAPGNSVYHVADDTPLTYGRFLEITSSALGLGPPRRVPVALARAVAGRDPVRAALRSARSSNARIKRELGWEPQFPSAEAGVPAAVAALGGEPVPAQALR